jgi:mRNA-degrading endonuclease RelE of RelBE toxin-antitoxin system
MGYYRLTYGRYRAIYSVDEDELPSGDMLVHCRILFVAVGQRKEHDRRDVYKIAKSLIDMGVIPPDPPTA